MTRWFCSALPLVTMLAAAGCGKGGQSGATGAGDASAPAANSGIEAAGRGTVVPSRPSGRHLVSRAMFDAVAGAYSGEVAQEHVREIVQYHRIQGSPMMAEAADKVVLAKLRAMGVEAELEQFASDGKTRYQTFTSPMGWDMRGGELWVESVGGKKNFTPMRLCRYSDVPMCVSTYSKGGNWTGELVDVGAGTGARDYEGKDVRGKVALASGYAARVVREAVLKHGAAGVVIYPRANDRADHPDMVRYNGIWPRAEELEKTSGGFQISANQYARLKELMREGPVTVRGSIDATLGPGQLTLVHAWFRAATDPGREVLVTAHLDHPKWSANDNATGAAAMLEMARTLKALVTTQAIPALRHTIHLMWVPEYFGTMAYLTKHPEARSCGAWDDSRLPDRGAGFDGSAPCIIANLNMDMVGEDTVKTNSRFYITRAPDSVPPFLNALMADVLEQTREANLYAQNGTRNYWPAMMIPHTGGSDHDALIAVGVPGTMLGHSPDWTHHTSEDTPDKTDASELRRVGVLATAAALWLATAGDADWQALERRSISDMMADYAGRLGAMTPGAESTPPERAALYLDAIGQLHGAMQQPSGANGTAGRQPESLWQPPRAVGSSGKGPRRLTLALLDDSATADLSREDRLWWQQQEQRFDSAPPGGGLRVNPPFAQVVFESMNLMDGKRDTGVLSQLVSAEFNIDLDRTWMDRLVAVLAAQRLVEL